VRRNGKVERDKERGGSLKGFLEFKGKLDTSAKDRERKKLETNGLLNRKRKTKKDETHLLITFTFQNDFLSILHSLLNLNI